ncbi:GDP-mannose 4,6-dehydratase [Frankia sp. AiPs1]|nr:GDP-mannose 4,6-dehydratase [Frankia sp. AiPs1]MCM3920977.1 GDP-mannose 4,6-dehydratase [Frankia sp. AiPs1]
MPGSSVELCPPAARRCVPGAFPGRGAGPGHVHLRRRPPQSRSGRDDPRLTVTAGDVCDADLVTRQMKGVDLVVHFAAESHVDRSIAASAEFVRTNALGTHTLLAAALWRMGCTSWCL